VLCMYQGGVNVQEKTTEFFRCMSCHRSLEMNEHLAKGCPSCKCGGRRFTPTRLSRWEVICYLLSHPAVLVSTLKAKAVRA
jgi:hypothetical protein